MKFKTLLLGTVLSVGLLASPAVQAAAFIKFDGIDGEAIDPDHAQWIDVLSTDWGIVLERDAASGLPTGKRQHKPVSVTKPLDKASPKLMEGIATGRVFPSVKVHLTRATSAGPVTYLEYELTNVIVTSWSTSGDADDRPTEEVSLNFEEVKMIYSEYDDAGRLKGKVEATWRVEEGTA